MASIGESKVVDNNRFDIAIDSGDKITEVHYGNVMLLQQFLPTVHQISGKFSIQLKAIKAINLFLGFTGVVQFQISQRKPNSKFSIKQFSMALRYLVTCH